MGFILPNSGGIVKAWRKISGEFLATLRADRKEFLQCFADKIAFLQWFEGIPPHSDSECLRFPDFRPGKEQTFQ